MRARTDPGASLLALATVLGLGLGPSAVTVPAAVPHADPNVVVIVSARSPVGPLSRNHLTDLYLGRASRFPDGRTAVPIDQDEGSATRELFYSEIIGRSTAQIKAHWSRIIFTGRGRPPKAVADGIEMRGVIAGNPSAIGYIDRVLVDASVRIVEVR